jgi:antitoxin Phd
MPWQLQEASQRFSEVVRRALESAQVVTRHGRPAVVVVAAPECERLERRSPFKDFLCAAPESRG